MPDLGTASVVGGPLSVLLVFLFDPGNLTADLARLVKGRMDIGVGGIRIQRIHQAGEITGGNILRRGPDHTRSRPGACNGPAVQRAFLGPSRTVSQIAAEEDHNAAGIARLTEMDVSLRHSARIR